MSDEELKKYYAVYADCWKLFRKYSDPKNDEGFWQALVDEAEEIVRKNRESEFVKRMVVAVVDEIERIHRERNA